MTSMSFTLSNHVPNIDYERTSFGVDIKWRLVFEEFSQLNAGRQAYYEAMQSRFNHICLKNKGADKATYFEQTH